MARKSRKRRPDNPARIAAPQPAPGELEIVQAFANTGAPAAASDAFADRGAAAGWLIRHGLFDDGSELDEDGRRRAVAVRGALRSLLATNGGARLDPEAVRRLERAAAGARLRLSFDDSGPAGFEAAGPSLDGALGKLLAIVVAARIEGRWPLVKLCFRDGCRQAFFDRSQTHNGMFCTRRCADRVRAQEFRRRQKRR